MAPEESTADSTISDLSKDVSSKDGAVARRREDDELTSLSWLQDKNLLKGIKLRGGGGSKDSADRLGQVDQVNDTDQSDLQQQSNPQQPLQQQQQQGEVTSSASAPASLHSKHHPHHIPYNPKVHTRWKPPYSFSCLIFMSIENSALKALPVKEIYAWILDHFPYYRTAPLGWKNSVRHNLSLNKCFKKLDKPTNLGKGSLWTVEPKYRLNLVQALMKAPAPTHPYTPPPPDNSRMQCEVDGSLKEDDERSIYTSSDEMIEDVVAARAMLALKHGTSNHLNSSTGKKEKTMFGSGKNKAGPDHSYTTATLTAFRGVDDAEERRKTAETADALLNLAGIRTPRSLSTKRLHASATDHPVTKRLHIS